MKLSRISSCIMAAVLVCVLPAGFGEPLASAAGTAAPSVGIWYSTWYAKLPTLNATWMTNSLGQSCNQFVGDINGDGWDDAVAMGCDGTWYVALSTGTSFGVPALWASRLGPGVDQAVADVNGDGKADLVTMSSAGDWMVALSTGTGFGAPTRWISGAGVGAISHQFGDVNGDGRADLCIFGANGHWYVALSNGSSFDQSQTDWGTINSTSVKPFIADMNGDGKADAAYFDAPNGSWWQTLSTGTSFSGGTANVVTGQAKNSDRQWVVDGTGDGYADLYWYSASSQTLQGLEYDRARQNLSLSVTLRTGYGDASTKILFGDMLGDRYGQLATLAYSAYNGGTWWVHRYRTDTTPTNTWANFGAGGPMDYVPMTTTGGGQYTTTYAQYDSGDPVVINEHLAMFDKAEIDWLLLDETNNLNVESGYILNRAHDVTVQLAAHNASAVHKIRYAFAIGGIQFNGDPNVIEYEARQVYKEYVQDSAVGGDNYYTVNGKPLLVVFCSDAQYNAWLALGGKNYSTYFTVRQSYGTAQGTGFYGWQLPASGTTGTNEAMGVMPGWNNHIGNIPPVPRNNGVYYSRDCWQPLLSMATLPQQVVINSFNEFAEDTAVEPADTSAYAQSQHREPWSNADGVLSPTMYWDMTVDFIHQLKHPDLTNRASSSFASTQGANSWSYEQLTYAGSTKTATSMAWDGSQWNGSHQWAIVASTWQHPAVDADSARVWTAPRAGQVTVSGLVQRAQPCGDGTGVRILLNDAQVWPATPGQKVLTTTGYQTFLLKVQVTAGDRVAFVANAVGTVEYDQVNWTPTITYT